jgi:Tol biopolymer transport system component
VDGFGVVLVSSTRRRTTLRSERTPSIASSKNCATQWPGRAAAGALVGTTIAAASMIYFRAAPGQAAPIRFNVSAPAATFLLLTSNQTTPTVSPDGRRVAFVAVGSNSRSLLWIRSLDTLEAQALAGTELASSLSWSPDSRTLAFVQGGSMKTIDASGGPVQTVCVCTGKGTWNRDGTIVFGSTADGLFKVPAAGGQPTPLTKPDGSRKESAHRAPWFLPDGRHFVFIASPTNTIWIGSLDSTETTKLLSADSQAQYANGHLLFVRQGTLLAQPFDERRLTLTGDAVPIAEQVQPDGGSGSSAFSVSETGVLAYRTGAAVTTTQLAWMDRAGKPLGAIGPPGRYRNPALSPDGTRLAVEVVDPGGRSEDIWLVELARGVMSRFTFDPANDLYPVWSPDGGRVMFSSDRQGGVFNLYQKMANGSGDDEPVSKSSEGGKRPYSWSPDGRYVAYINYPAGGLGVLPLFGDRQPLKPPPGGFGTSLAQVSPDGRWMAYGSTESGRYEVYVRSFPMPGGKWQISKDGAVSPRWRGDGKELFYYAADGQLMAVPINHTATALEVGTPTRLFAPRVLNGPVSPLGFRAQYDVTRDGQRFLLNVPEQDAAPPSITVAVNWPAGLKK